MKRSRRSGISISYPDACISSIEKGPMGRKKTREKNQLGFPDENQLYKSPLSAVCCSGIWSERCGNVSTFFTDSAGAGADRSRRSALMILSASGAASEAAASDSVQIPPCLCGH